MNGEVNLESLEPGLHIISSPSSKEIAGQDFPIRHYGVLDVGNTAGLCPGHAVTVLIHQTPPKIQTVPFDYSDEWQYEEPIAGVGVRIRLQKALNNNDYDVMRNNCEQFVNYIKSGKKQSGQVEVAVTAATVVGTGFIGYKLLKGVGRLVGSLFKVS